MINWFVRIPSHLSATNDEIDGDLITVTVYAEKNAEGD